MAKSNKVNVLLVIGILAFGYMALVGVPWAEEVQVQPTTDEGALKTCDSTTTPDIRIDSYDFDNPGTASTEAANIYRKVGDNTWNNWTQGTAITDLEVGETYEFVMGITTEDSTDYAYGEMFTKSIPCSELVTVEKPVYNDEIETELSSTFYNTDSDASAETFVAGQTQSVSLKIVAGSDEYFGNPTISENTMVGSTGSNGQSKSYPNIVCMNLNSSQWDAPEKVSFDGVDMKTVSQPKRHDSESGFTTYCYEAPVLDDTLMENNKYILRLNADDTNAPADDATASIYAANYYVDAEDSKIKFGVEDEEGNAVGTDAADTVTLDFTA